MIPFLRLSGILLIVIFVVSIAAAQGPATGIPPFSSSTGGPDVIDLANLNSHLDIPVLNKPGRGTNFTYDLGYDSSVWYPVTIGSTKTWQPVSGTWGWQGLIPAGAAFISYSMTGVGPVPCGQHNQYYYYRYSFSNFKYSDSFGVAHPIFISGTYVVTDGDFYCPAPGASPTTTPWTAAAYDGSGYTLKVTPTSVWVSAYVVASNGATLYPPVYSNPSGHQGAYSSIDRNGNKITSSNGTYTDTLGTTALTVAGTAPSNTTFTYTAPSGAAAYTMKYATKSIRTNFGCALIGDYGTNGTTTANLVSEIDLPDISVNPSDKYTFTYEATPGYPGFVTGRLASVTLPTGGTINYTYTGGSTGNITCADGSTPGLERVLSDGASWSATWNYTRTAGTGSSYATKVTDPANNDTIIQFQGIYETQRDIYNTSGPTFSSVPISEATLQTSNLMRELQTCYNGAAAPCTGTAISAQITTRKAITILSGGLQSEHDDIWNTYGAPTETDDYDYGVAPHGGLLKKVTAGYATLAGINDFRQTVTTQDVNLNVVSEISYNYDEGTPTATSGTPQHTTPPGARGNLTSLKMYTSGSSYLTESFTYYDTGTTKTSIDTNAGVTTNTFGACGNSFPTSVTEAVTTLSTSSTWNCTGGVTLMATDENGKITTTAYTDAYFWRPASITDPSGAVTNYCYGLLSTSGTCTVNTTQSESALTFNSSNSVVNSLTTLDGLGRVRIQQSRQSPTSSNFDSAETDYDSLGRASRATLPYAAAAGQTNSNIAAIATTYDPLDRPLTLTDGGNGVTTYSYGQVSSQTNDTLVTRTPAPTGENTKVRQMEYDGLGRLTSVCEVTAGTVAWPGGNCAQTTAKTGYWTKYTYDPLANLTGVTQDAQAAANLRQSRSFAYDWKSRMISETVPEIGANGNGIATYVFDSDATCGTSGGDLVKRVDAAGNVICSSYDALHRETARTYPSGPNSGATPQKHFVYDSATVNALVMANAKAHLAEAYTCNSPCSTKSTDIGLSYTVRGELTDTYESTPNSGGAYYHVSQSYWANGGVNQLTGPGIPTITYTPDGKSRINTVTASSGQSPVSSTVYNSADLPTTINLGSGTGDSDTFTWDPQTNRMTQYKFTVNSTSLTGALGWNANATLQTQNVTDAFNSLDTQNCGYVYDDVNRVTSANCGSAASQTFSYDVFGNMNKSGSPYAFNPTYSNTINRISSVGSTSASYDSDGNVLNDTVHSYAWDAEGHPLTVDSGQSNGVSLAFDALGRMAEQHRTAGYTQIVYSPSGHKLALMTGSTLQKAMVPLAGKAFAIYNASGPLYYAHPDLLGSIRLATTPTRTMYFDTAYAPFGETYASAGGANLDPAYTGQMDDTGQRQDTVGAIYDFPAREYSTQGRWPSPDPARMGATCPKDPQTQNRYAYVRGNPITYTDPTGMDGACDDDPFCGNPWCDPWWGCGGVGERFSSGGGGGNEKPIPFPWPLLPIGFFGGQSAKKTCNETISKTRQPTMGDECGKYYPPTVMVEAWSCEGDISCCETKATSWRKKCKETLGGYPATGIPIFGGFYTQQCCKTVPKKK